MFLRFVWLEILFRFLPARINLRPYLRRFSSELNEEWEKFRIVHDYGQYGSQRFHNWGLYRDGEFSFVLCSASWFSYRPLALVSFNVYRDYEDGQAKLRVVQIQGVKTPDGTNPLEGLRWEKMLLEIVIDWAKKQKFHCVEVQSAAANRWKMKVPMEKLRLRYDVVAKRRGFELKPNGESFALRLV